MNLNKHRGKRYFCSLREYRGGGYIDNHQQLIQTRYHWCSVTNTRSCV